MGHAALVCPDCGNLKSVCSDPDIDWHPREDVCWATATRLWGARRLRAKYEDVEAEDGAIHPLEGVGVYVTQDPIGEDEDDPFALVAQQTPREQDQAAD